MLRRVALLAPFALAAACSFPDYQFDDARYNARTGNGLGGTEGEGGRGTAGTTSKVGGSGGSPTKGGSSGTGGGPQGGTAQGGETGKAGAAGTSAGTGASSGVGGGASGSGGAAAGGAGTGGTVANGGKGGSGAGVGGSAGSGGDAAGTGGGSGTTGGGGKPATACTKASQCKPTELCSELFDVGEEVYLKCSVRNPDAGALKPGAVCGSSSPCESFSCLTVTGATKGTCSGTCETSQDCALDAICTTVNLSQSSQARLCYPSCKNDAACPADGKLNCAFYDDPVADTVGFACQPSGGTAGFGETADPKVGCTWGITLGGATDSKCTKPCEAESECGAPFPTCRSLPIKTPSGAQTTIKVCAPAP